MEKFLSGGGGEGGKGDPLVFLCVSSSSFRRKLRVHSLRGFFSSLERSLGAPFKIPRHSTIKEKKRRKSRQDWGWGEGGGGPANGEGESQGRRGRASARLEKVRNVANENGSEKKKKKTARGRYARAGGDEQRSSQACQDKRESPDAKNEKEARRGLGLTRGKSGDTWGKPSQDVSSNRKAFRRISFRGVLFSSLLRELLRSGKELSRSESAWRKRPRGRQSKKTAPHELLRRGLEGGLSLEVASEVARKELLSRPFPPYRGGGISCKGWF